MYLVVNYFVSTRLQVFPGDYLDHMLPTILYVCLHILCCLQLKHRVEHLRRLRASSIPSIWERVYMLQGAWVSLVAIPLPLVPLTPMFPVFTGNRRSKLWVCHSFLMRLTWWGGVSKHGNTPLYIPSGTFCLTGKECFQALGFLALLLPDPSSSSVQTLLGSDI